MSDGIGWHTPDDDVSAPVICRRIALPLFLWPHFNGAFGQLTDPDNWVEVGNMPIDDIIQAYINAYDDMEEGCMAGLIGSIVVLATDDIPENVLLCDGATYLDTEYPKLFDVIHPHFKAQAKAIEQPFSVPDLRNRFVIGEDEKEGIPIGSGGMYASNLGNQGSPESYALRYGIVAE